MTIPATEPQKIIANGDGVATVFSFSPMNIFAASDLQVTKVDASGTETLLTQGSGAGQYQVTSPATFPGTPVTGSITYPSSGTKLQTGEKIIMKAVLPVEQATDLQNQGGYFPDVQETQFDKLLKIIIQQAEIQSRSLTVPIGATGVSVALPSPIPNAVLGWDPTGTILTNSATGVTVVTKGTLIVGDGLGPGLLALGLDGQVLKAEAAQPLGVKWDNDLAGFLNTSKGVILTNTLNQDTSANVVTMLQSNASVITDLGTLVTPKRELTCDLSTTGAGGIDTGSRVAGRWYSIWYCFKGQTASSPDSPTNPIDDTLVAHREPLLESIEFFVGDTIGQKVNSVSSNQKVSTGFSHATDDMHVASVMCEMSRVGTPTGNMWVTIETDNAGVPSGTVVTGGTSRKRLASNPQGADEDQMFEFPGVVTLTAGTQYHIVMNVDYATDAVNHVEWRKATTNAYANGTAAHFDGTTWTAQANDDQHFIFNGWDDSATKTRLAVTLPTGYTEKVRVGIINNNTSDVIKPFTSIDNEMQCFSDIANSTHWWRDNIPSSRQVATQVNYLPPCAAFVDFRIASDSNVASQAALGSHDAADISASSLRVGIRHATMSATMFTTADHPNQDLTNVFIDRSMLAWQSNRASGISFYVTRIKWYDVGGVLTPA